MANINAALGYSQFKKLKYFLKYKKLNKVYLNLFKKFDGKIKLITNFNKTDSNFGYKQLFWKIQNLEIY